MKSKKKINIIDQLEYFYLLFSFIYQSYFHLDKCTSRKVNGGTCSSVDECAILKGLGCDIINGLCSCNDPDIK